MKEFIDENGEKCIQGARCSVRRQVKNTKRYILGNYHACKARNGALVLRLPAQFQHFLAARSTLSPWATTWILAWWGLPLQLSSSAIRAYLLIDCGWVANYLQALNAFQCFRPPANHLVQHPQASDPTFKSWNCLNLQKYANNLCLL